MTLVWNDSRYATGIPEIDAQHQAMFVRVNDLLAATVANRPVAEVRALLDTLGGEASFHFDCEEVEMERRRCSVCAANKIAHRWFMRSLGQLGEILEQGGVTAGFHREVEARICDWLTTHLVGMDAALRRTVDAKS